MNSWEARRSHDLNGAAYEQGAVRSQTHSWERPGERRYFVHKRIGRAVKSFVTSGFSPTAAAAGFLAPQVSRTSKKTPVPRQFQQFALTARRTAPITAPRPVTRLALAVKTGTTAELPRAVSRVQMATTRVGRPTPFAPTSRAKPTCNFGQIFRNGRCVSIPQIIVDPLDVLRPRSRRFAPDKPTQRRTTAMPRDRGFQAVEGAFGMPAAVPDEEVRTVLVCPPGMVLGHDELCYMKALLPKRSQFRKWRGQARPPVSAADARAIRKAASAKDRVLKLAKSVGLHASKTKPASGGRKRAHQHLLAAPARELRVISEETD